MDTTLTPSPKRYRAFGILFFLSGATFHCIDLLGVERTFAWGTGMVFLASIILTIIFWIRVAINKRFWTFFF
jgi:hypothetical protein